jgi:protoporphyrinogen oxidase
MHDAQVLAEKLAEGLPIRHGMTVDQIQWNASGVIVQCQGGQQIEADAVIVTVSLGVLKVLSTSSVFWSSCIKLWFFSDVAFAPALA